MLQRKRRVANLNHKPTVVMRLWLPDIPGTLGRVAAAIGQVGGDVVGIEILERGSNLAIDELTVSLPEDASLDALIAAVTELDGVTIEDVYHVETDRSEQSVLALDVAARIMETDDANRLDTACALLRKLLHADWCVIANATDAANASPIARSGTLPDLQWVAAFLDGSSHLPPDIAQEHTPADIAWAPIGGLDATIVLSRQRGAFRLRERQHLALIARIVAMALLVATQSEVAAHEPVRGA